MSHVHLAAQELELLIVVHGGPDRNELRRIDIERVARLLEIYSLAKRGTMWPKGPSAKGQRLLASS